MNQLIEILGWIGSVEVIAAYGLNSYQKIKANSWQFQFLNLTGAFFLIINSVYKQAYPFTLINAVWAIIAISALVRMYSQKKETES